MERSRKLVAWIIGLILIALILGFTFLWYTRGRYIQSTNDAYVHAKTMVVTNNVAGTIQKINVKNFQPVKKGDVLAIIDKTLYVLELKTALANIDRIKSQMKMISLTKEQQANKLKALNHQYQAKIDQQQYLDQELKRYNSLKKSNTVSQNLLDEHHAKSLENNERILELEQSIANARSYLASFQFKKAQLLAELSNAEIKSSEMEMQINNTIIKAPADGVVSNVVANTGEYLASGKSIMFLVDLTQLWINANFPETEIQFLKTGQPVIIKVDAFPEKTLQGIIARFSPASQMVINDSAFPAKYGEYVRTVQRFPVIINLLGPDDVISSLKAGMSAIVTIDSRLKEIK